MGLSIRSVSDGSSEKYLQWCVDVSGESRRVVYSIYSAGYDSCQ